MRIQSFPRLRKSLFVASLLLLGAPFVSGSRHETSIEFLKRHGIDVSDEGLIAALKNTDSEIRDNSALALADRKVVTAIPALADALASEKDPEMGVNLAEDIARLGDPAGVADLKHFCDSAPPSPRLKATLYLLRDFSDESCFNAVVSILRSKSESDHLHVATAISLVPWFHQLSASDEQQLISLTVGLLGDPSPFIRITAGQALSKVGGADVILALQQAIRKESDEVARSAMKAELDKLQAKDN
jgi:HEAT repeat protein